MDARIDRGTYGSSLFFLAFRVEWRKSSFRIEGELSENESDCEEDFASETGESEAFRI